MQADGAKQEAALVDSLAVGLAAAVPRLSVARAALAAWMKGDRTTPVDLRLNPDSSAKACFLQSCFSMAACSLIAKPAERPRRGQCSLC